MFASVCMSSKTVKAANKKSKRKVSIKLIQVVNVNIIFLTYNGVDTDGANFYYSNNKTLV